MSDGRPLGNVGILGVVVPGAAGRMGRAIIQLLAETEGAKLAAALEREGHAELGKDVGDGVVLSSSLEAALDTASRANEASVAIDFTAPAATARLAALAAERGVALVIGTTGLGEAERAVVDLAATRVPVVLSPNMSVGVNVMLGLLDMAARALGDGYDMEIVETHHRLKKDAPSGTALRMAEVLAAARSESLAEVGIFGREGNVGARTAAEIGVLAVRGGDVVGDHTAFFLGQGDRIEITHKASSRDTFARGAVRAALWVVGKRPGLYDMRDVLGLR